MSQPHRGVRAGVLISSLLPIWYDNPDRVIGHQRLLDSVRELSGNKPWDVSKMDHLALPMIRALRQLTAQYLMLNAYKTVEDSGLSYQTSCIAQKYEGVEDFCHKVVL